MGRILEYCRMSPGEIAALDREKTVLLMAVSPIEVHGPHLPLGTDVYVSEELLKRYVAALRQRHPELDCVVLPPLYAGGTPLPVKGSIAVPAKTLEPLLVAFAKGLAEQGFRYLLIADNHGGPGHQLAIEAAARKAYKKYRFYLIDPFNYDYRKMVECDEAFLAGTGLGKGTCGDDTDAHAGTNETSLMMVAAPEMISPAYREVPASRPPERKGVSRALMSLAGLFRSVGARRFGGDLDHLAGTLAWVGSKDMKPYMGDPKKASKTAGEAMFDARVRAAMVLTDRALAGEPVRIDPLLWQIRAIRRFF